MATSTTILPQVLQELDKDSLIGIIIKQGQRIEELTEREKELLRQLAELEKAGKRQAAPFRIEDEKRKQPKRKAGAKKGHKGHYRQVSGPIDERQEVALEGCPQCGKAVSDVKSVKQVVEELVLRPYRIALTTYQGKCKDCGPVHSTHPMQSSHAQGSAGCHLGKQATATALLLNHRYGMSKRKVAELFTEHFDLPLSIGGLVQIQHRLAKGFTPEYEELAQQAQDSEVLHSDETSWYVGEPKHWLWTFTNPDLTYYRVEEKRNREVVEQVIGDDYQGVLVSDCLVIYDDVCATQHKCYAHHLKAIKRALQNEPESAYLLAWKQLLQDAIAWKDQQGKLSAQAYQDGYIKLAIRSAELFKKPRSSPAEESIHNRLEKQADHLFTFLLHQSVPATNNTAERSLRPAVVHRKISCGNKTRKGADTWQVLASVVTTTEQRNGVPFDQKVADLIEQRLQSR
jgi:hypothetical protein